MQVRLITKTVGVDGTEYDGKSIDEIIVGNARVSSSREVNELFDEGFKLIRHCVSEGHWSIMEQANLGFQVVTSRAMGREILRHQIHPQEFSQRYAIATEFEPIELRMQAKSNRQSSSDVFDPIIEITWGENITASEMINSTLEDVQFWYLKLIELGVARETARMILPETTQTVMNLNAPIRSWISFLNQRLHKTAQKEIRLVAEAIRDVFIKECPQISEAMFNFEGAYDLHILERIIIEKHIKKGLIQWVKQ